MKVASVNSISNVLKETKRLHPSFPRFLPRECGQACEIHGYQVLANSKVIMNA